MRFVAVKDVDQQARLCWHRVREGYEAESLAIANRLRGLLAEFGLAIARSDSALQRALADDLLRTQLPNTLLPLLDDLYAHWKQAKQRIAAIDCQVAVHAKADERSVRAQQLVGVGPLTADALAASIGNGHEFANGRQLAAWLGLTPTQHSSGGKARMGGISCRGDNYLRTLLIQGARSCLQQAKLANPQTATAEQIWIKSLASRLPFGKVLIAIAKKHARQLWAMLRRSEDYDSEAWLHHPMVQRTCRKAIAA